MKNKVRPTFGDDQAKKNPWEEDRLGVAPIAKRLAYVIRTLDAPLGYVIGINGVWGHGKSTLLNFTCAHLDKHNEEAQSDDGKVHIIDFRPWMVSGHQDLVSAFFKILSESLGPRESWFKRKLRKLLKQVGTSSDAVMDAMAKVAVAVDIGITKGVATAVVNVAKRPLKYKIDEFLQDESLQSAHEGLVEQLRKVKWKFLVTIDDIDRLTEDEVKSIMQLVKTVGQLPNVVYLLSYDRTKISEAFDEQDTDNAPRHSEKIIQYEVELPKPSKNSLLRVLDGEISFMLSTAKPDESRWFTIASKGIRRWIEKPRDVLRLANSVKFAWPALEGEIDPADLLAMEGLKLFDTDVFKWIRDNRDFLFRDAHYQYLDESARKSFVERFVQSLGAREDKDQVLDVVSVLFPSIGELIERQGLYHSEAYHSIASRRGIASQAGYDAYFALAPSSDAIPKRVVDEVVSGINSEAQLVFIINSYIGKRSSSGSPMISEFIEELRHRYDAGQPPAVSQPLVNALFEKADTILAEPRSSDFFTISPSLALLFLLDKMLRLAGKTNAAELLKSAFDDTVSLAFSADIYVDIGRDLFIFPGDEDAKRDPPLVEKVVFDELGQLLLKKIIQAADEGRLDSAPRFSSLLIVWTHLDKSDKPRIWTSQRMTGDVSFMLKVALGLLDHTASTKGKTYRFTERPEPALYDFNVIHDAAQNHLQTAKLNDDERQQLEALVKGAEAMKCEKPQADATANSGT